MNENEMYIFIKNNPKVSCKDIAKKLNMSGQAVYSLLMVLFKENKISRTKENTSKKYIYYVVEKKQEKEKEKETNSTWIKY